MFGSEVAGQHRLAGEMLRASIGEAAARSGLASARKVQEVVEPAGAVATTDDPRYYNFGDQDPFAALNHKWPVNKCPRVGTLRHTDREPGSGRKKPTPCRQGKNAKPV